MTGPGHSGKSTQCERRGTLDIKRRSKELGCRSAHTPRLLTQQKEKGERHRTHTGREKTEQLGWVDCFLGFV